MRNTIMAHILLFGIVLFVSPFCFYMFCRPTSVDLESQTQNLDSVIIDSPPPPLKVEESRKVEGGKKVERKEAEVERLMQKKKQLDDKKMPIKIIRAPEPTLEPLSPLDSPPRSETPIGSLPQVTPRRTSFDSKEGSDWERLSLDNESFEGLP